MPLRAIAGDSSCDDLITQAFRFVEIGVGARGISLGLPGNAAVVVTKRIIQIEANGVVVVGDGVVIVAFSCR